MANLKDLTKEELIEIYENRVNIIVEHLKKEVAILKKYGDKSESAWSLEDLEKFVKMKKGPAFKFEK